MMAYEEKSGRFARENTFCGMNEKAATTHSGARKPAARKTLTGRALKRPRRWLSRSTLRLLDEMRAVEIEPDAHAVARLPRHPALARQLHRHLVSAVQPHEVLHARAEKILGLDRACGRHVRTLAGPQQPHALRPR